MAPKAFFCHANYNNQARVVDFENSILPEIQKHFAIWLSSPFRKKRPSGKQMADNICLLRIEYINCIAKLNRPVVHLNMLRNNSISMQEVFELNPILYAFSALARTPNQLVHVFNYSCWVLFFSIASAGVNALVSVRQYAGLLLFSRNNRARKL